MPKAKPSTRATSNVTLQAGLLNIPISVYSGITDENKVVRKEFLPVTTGEGDDAKTELHPVGRGSIDKETGELIDTDQVVRLVNTEHGPVPVSDEEVEKLLNLSVKTIEVLAFQPLHLFHQGHYIPRGLMHVEPTKVKAKSRKIVPDGVARAFVALLAGMRAEGVMAVCEYTDRGTPKPAILLPNAELWLLHNTDAVREQRELPDIDYSEGNLKTVRELIIAPLRDNAVLDLSDRRSALINAFATEKAESNDTEVVASKAVEDPQVPESDLLAALAASVAAAKAAS